MQTTSGTSCLRIHRLRVNCLVSEDHPRPEQVKRRMVEAVEQSLPVTLASTLSQAFSETDQSLWFIRRLDLSVQVNAAGDRDELARCVAVRLAHELVATWATDGVDPNVIRFNSFAEYLAMFLTDLAEGDAWGRWYYHPFSGLRMLPTSAALRTAICDDASIGLAALHRLPLPMLKQIVLHLSDADATRILEALGANGRTETEEVCYERARGALVRLGSILEPISEAESALLLYVDASRGADGSPLLAEASRTLIRMDRCFGQRSVSGRRRLANTLRRRDAALLFQIAGPADAERLCPLLRLNDKMLCDLLDQFVDQNALHPHEADLQAESRQTSFGGVFFLLPLIDKLPLKEATRLWPDADGIPSEGMVRWLLLVKCAGRNRAVAAAQNLLIRELAGVASADLSRELLVRWRRKITPDLLKMFLVKLAQWRLSDRTLGGRVGVLSRVGVNQSRTMILLDAARGCWVFAGRVSPNRPDLLEEVLASLFPLDLHLQPVLLCHPADAELIRSLSPQITVMDLNDFETIESSEIAGEAKPMLSALSRLDEALNYFSLPSGFGLSRVLDRALSVASQGLLRDFAWRLSGFAWSHPDFLYQNFLNCRAILEEEPARRVVRLSPPPLNLILNITGLNRAKYDLSWLKGLPFELFPDPA